MTLGSGPPSRPSADSFAVTPQTPAFPGRYLLGLGNPHPVLHVIVWVWTCVWGTPLEVNVAVLFAQATILIFPTCRPNVATPHILTSPNSGSIHTSHIRKLHPVMSFRCLVYLLIGIVTLVTANVEKTIFLGPEAVNIPQQSPTLSDLHIDVLNPTNYSRRTDVDAIFPTSELPKGTDTWLVLEDLTEGQRYEVRICWLATVRLSFS